jgi:hypothetical protein
MLNTLFFFADPSLLGASQDENCAALDTFRVSSASEDQPRTQPRRNARTGGGATGGGNSWQGRTTSPGRPASPFHLNCRRPQLQALMICGSSGFVPETTGRYPHMVRRRCSS